MVPGVAGVVDIMTSLTCTVQQLCGSVRTSGVRVLVTQWQDDVVSLTKQVTTSTLMSSGYKSPVGRLMLVASAQGLRAILWPNDDPRRVPGVAYAKKGSNPIIESTIRQLDEYFAGTRHEFDVPLDAVGT